MAVEGVPSLHIRKGSGRLTSRDAREQTATSTGAMLTPVDPHLKP